VAFSLEEWFRLFWIIAISIIYILFYFALGIAVSSWVQRSATALAVCLFCWVMFVLAIPNLVPLAVKHFAPIPPASKIEVEKDADERFIRKELLPHWREELSNSNQYASGADMQREWERRVVEEKYKRSEKIERLYNMLIQRQVLLIEQVSRISPSAAYVFAATSYAGTGIADFFRWQTEVDDYQRMCADNVQTQLMSSVFNDKAAKPRPVPAFEPKPLQLATTLNQCWPDCVLLSGSCVLLLLLAVVGFIRYDPR